MQNRGFTLLIAVLIGSLMLSIGFAIFNFAFKELILASSAKESQIAFFAADAGLECALYHDQQVPAGGAFRRGGTGPEGSIECAGENLSIILSTATVDGEGADTRSFRWDFGSRGCVDVTVYKFQDVGRTTIEARGFNVSCAVDDPRKTERGLRIEYTNENLGGGGAL